MTVFFSQLINGLSLGSIYALIALGYSMVYGIILLLNFAHGDVIMVGAYMSWFVMNQLGLGPVTAVCATIITCTLLGVVIEKIAYTPLRNAPRISLLITAIGVSFFLEYTAELILGSGAKVIPAYYTNQTFRIGSVPLGLTSVITLLVTVLSMLALTFLVQKTKLGKAMRAVSEDMDTAATKRDEGLSAEELVQWLEENKLKLHHWFFSTDLTFYIKGGRVSKTAGFIGTILGICPLLNMDDKGRLIPREKIRTKKRVIREIVDKMEQFAEGGLDYSGKCYISESACMEDAKAVATLVEARFPHLNGKVEINSIGTTIGSHTGPGTVALFFFGTPRRD